MAKIVSEIFKAYDIRGIYPKEFNQETAFKIGRALVIFFKTKKIIIGRDMRISSDDIFKALAEGIREQGADVINIGLVSTDCLYFASGKLNLAGVMITASHNPKQYNGLKICGKEASPVGERTGLKEIKRLVQKNNFPKAKKTGRLIKKDILKSYARHILSFIDKENIKPLKIVVDAGNGMAGKIVPLVFKDLPGQIIPLYFKLDGSFPNHLASPVDWKNLISCQKEIKKSKADLGLAFDGDADRVFFIDEKGKPVRSSLIIALIAQKILLKNPGAGIIYNLICSKIVPETIKQLGGRPIIERVGHSFIKETMKKTRAVFAGEHSGHYYFQKNYRADSGLIAALIVIEIISKANLPLSQIIRPFDKYWAIEETNFKVDSKEKILKRVEKKYRNGKISHLDGLTVEYKNWWFNLRPSQTEPLLRLNIEAETKKLLGQKKDELSKIVRSK